jgi:diguanylate cyclase (GGDEF)-like protein
MSETSLYAVPVATRESESPEAFDRFLRYGCNTEPIHQLGLVQPHGILVVVDVATAKIVQFSAGLPRYFALAPTIEQIAGSCVTNWVNAERDALVDVLGSLSFDHGSSLELSLRSEVKIAQSGISASPERQAQHECTGYRIGEYAVLEWIPIGPTRLVDFAQLRQLQQLNRAMQRLRRSDDADAFLRDCVNELQKLCQYDRVMIYRFRPDWTGEIVAEAVSKNAEKKYIGMRFPAGDIPPQARALYEQSTFRSLADIRANDDPLLPAVLPNGKPLDQSLSLLRSMSKAHVAYLTNMGVRATMSISLLKQGKLWGLVACHHMTLRVPPYHMREIMRTACELISNIVTMRTSDLERLGDQTAINDFNETMRGIGNAIASYSNLAGGCADFSDRILSQFSANSWGFSINGETFVHRLRKAGTQRLDQSDCDQLIEEISRIFDERNSSPHLQFSTLSGLHSPKLKEFCDAAGLLVQRFGENLRDFCFLTRPEVQETIHWAGKPEKVEHVAADGSIFLEPRRSFEQWTEQVTGNCEEWNPLECDLLGKLARMLADHAKNLLTRELNEKLRWRARHDHLTGLLNRSTLEAELNQMMSSADPNIALFMIDMDHFKRINDTLGHRVGDEVIKEVGRRIALVIRDGDVAARFGGDEFVLIARLDRKTPGSAHMIARRLQDSMKSPIVIDEHVLPLSLSIGTAICPTHGQDAVTLMRHADIALYESKGGGRARISVYSEEMEELARDTFILENELRHALSSGQLRLFYQPKVQLSSQEVVGLEALVRWQHPTHGLLAPNAFVPVAERSKLINLLGNWVIHEAAAHSARWVTAGYKNLPVAINVSFAQFADANFVGEIGKALQMHKLSPDTFEVELTETVLMEDTEMAIKTIRKLSSMGVKVTLDDFGTGYSSLSYLHQLPLDSLKIDRSFISELHADPQAQVITNGVLGLSRGLKIQTVAEGVETHSQRSWLIDNGCDLAQGYLYSRPVPATDLPSTIQRIETLCM